MYCNSCGKEIEKGMKFCGHCGNPVEQENSIQSNSINKSNSNQGKKSGNNKGILKIAIVVLAVTALLLVVCLFALSRLSNDNKNKATGEEKKVEKGNVQEKSLINIEELGERYKLYVSDNHVFDENHYKLVDLLGDNTPELVCFNKFYVLKRIITFDGKRTSEVELKGGFERPMIVNEKLRIDFCYGQPGEGFALNVIEYSPESTNKAAADEESILWTTINGQYQVTGYNEIYCHKIYSAPGVLDATLFRTTDMADNTREKYEEDKEELLSKYNKSFDLMNDSYETIDEAVADYESE